MRTYVVDIEADGLYYDAHNIWCIVAKEYGKPNYVEFYEDSLMRSAQFFEHNCDVIVGHNFAAYDALVIRKLLGIEIPQTKIVDTMVLSQVLNPDRPSHSLEWWGMKLGFPKSWHEDFSKFSLELLAYCRRDVDLTEKVMEALLDEARTRYGQRLSPGDFTEGSRAQADGKTTEAKSTA